MINSNYFQIKTSFCKPVQETTSLMINKVAKLINENNKYTEINDKGTSHGD